MLTIDRFEGELAVCQQDDGTMINIKREVLPPDCAEGDALEAKDGIYTKKDNQLRRDQMKSKMQSLFAQKR